MRLFIILLLPHLLYAKGLGKQEGDCGPIPKRIHNGKIVYSPEPTHGKFRVNTTARVDCDDGYMSDGKYFEEVTCELYDEFTGDFIWLPIDSAMVDCKPEKSTLASSVSRRIVNFYDSADIVEKAFTREVLRQLSK